VAAGRARRVLRLAHLLLVPAIFAGVFAGVLPHIADLDDVWRVIRGMTGPEVGLLAALTAWNVATYWPVLLAGMPGLSWTQAILVNQSSTTVAMTVPGGGILAVGVSYRMYRSWGFGPTEVALSAISTGIANSVVKLTLPLAAVALVAAEGRDAGDLLSSALVSVAVLAAASVLTALVLRKPRTARALGSLFDRVTGMGRRDRDRTWGETADRFRAHLLTFLRQRWAALALTTIVSQVSVYAVLLASLRVAGVSDARVGWAEALAVFAVVRLASAVPIMPGNVALAELEYVGGLVLAGGGRTEVVAAVLVFRFLTFFLQIPLGGFTYLAWRRGLGSPHRARQQQDEPDQHRGAPGEGGRGKGQLGPGRQGEHGDQEEAAVPAAQQ